MAKIGLFFGSDEGNTERVAGMIQARLGVEHVDIYDIADVTQVEFTEYEQIILGIPTWDFGQIQSDWEDFWEDVQAIDFTGKTIALFGLGDQFGYGDYFLDAMGMLHEVIVTNGATIVGHWSTEGYDYDASKADFVNPDTDTRWFVGLAIDEDQQEELTESRVDQWCGMLKQAFTIA